MKSFFVPQASFHPLRTINQSVNQPATRGIRKADARVIKRYGRRLLSTVYSRGLAQVCLIILNAVVMSTIVVV